jgi:hypothetical protein
MGIEIDFIRAGEESKSGQAIALRFGNLHGPRDEQTVMVVDGRLAPGRPVLGVGRSVELEGATVSEKLDGAT